MGKSGGWEAVREALRQRIGPAAFDAWFRTLGAKIEGSTLIVRCPDRFSRDWIRSRYGRVLEEAATDFGHVEYQINRGSTESPRATSVPAQAEPTRSPRPRPSFDDFVMGPGNALALEAARAVALGRAGRCSPLVLAATSGLGKTHLCRAIQRELGENVVYRSSEEFTSEVTHAIRMGQMQAIRQRYRRSLNVLILEDVQFLEGKRATQIELFHTLDHLISHSKTVVLSCDRPPGKIEGLDTKLASRMTSGLVACMTPPELDTRRNILREKAAAGGVRVPDQCLELLARRPLESVRELLTGLNQVVARASLLRQPVTPELVAEAIAAVELTERPRTLGEILELTSRTYGLSPEQLSGRSRQRRVVRPRQFAMYLCRRYTDASLKEIGRAFGRDHSSVIYAIEVVERRTLERPQVRYELETLASRLSVGTRLPPGLSPARSAAGRTHGMPQT